MSDESHRRIQPLFGAVAFVAFLFSSCLTGVAIAQDTTGKADPDLAGKSVLATLVLSGQGLAAWYVWYDIRVSKPRAEKSRKEELDALAKRYTDAAKETEERHAKHWELVNNNSRQDLNEMWKSHREDLRLQREETLRLTDAVTRLIDTVDKIQCRFEHGVKHGC